MKRKYTSPHAAPPRLTAQPVPETVNMQIVPNETFLKGRLTQVSGLLLAFLEGPELIDHFIEWHQTFTTAMNHKPSALTIVAILGIIWGMIRRRHAYYEATTAARVGFRVP